jgi:hypothetical protein
MSRHVPIWTARGDLVHAVQLGSGDQTAAWMFDELRYVHREAQTRAQLAYEAWCDLPGRDGYVVYWAAQDRADAAQDQLASWVRGRQTDRPSRCPWS